MSPAFEFPAPLLQGFRVPYAGYGGRGRGGGGRDTPPLAPAGGGAGRSLLWLLEVCVRVSVDALHAARERRNLYVGPWLPEPLVGRDGGGALGGPFPTLGERPPHTPPPLPLHGFPPPHGAAEACGAGGPAPSGNCSGWGIRTCHGSCNGRCRPAGPWCPGARIHPEGGRPPLRRTRFPKRDALRGAVPPGQCQGHPGAAGGSHGTGGAALDRWGWGGSRRPAHHRGSGAGGPASLLEMAARARPGTALVRGGGECRPRPSWSWSGEGSPPTITAVAGPGGRIQRILMVRNPAKLARARLPRPPAPVEV